MFHSLVFWMPKNPDNMPAKSKLLLFLGLAQIVVIGALLLQSRSLKNQAANALAFNTPARGPAERLELIQRENVRLKKDLSEIPLLQAEARRLENALAEQSARASEVWSAHSNQLQSAIEQSRRNISEIETWEKEKTLAEIRQRAAARLAQKAAEGPTDYVQFDANLRQIGERMRNLMTARREWDAMEKTDDKGEAFKARMAKWWTEYEGAKGMLGEDIKLFEELPVRLKDDFSKTPFLRSVLPDQRGFTVTVYADGNVQWSPLLK